MEDIPPSEDMVDIPLSEDMDIPPLEDIGVGSPGGHTFVFATDVSGHLLPTVKHQQERQ